MCNITGCSAGELSAALTIFEIFQLVKPMDGNRFRRIIPENDKRISRNDRPNFKQTNQTKLFVTGFVSFIRNHFHGISRKYLQGYIAAFWLSLDRELWGVDSIKLACHKSPYISYQDLIDYITPQVVQLFDWEF